MCRLQTSSVMTFTIEGDEYIAIGGRNGCGKTTITRLLVGLEKASEGRMYYNGTDITSMPPSKRGQLLLRIPTTRLPNV